jgi:uncharacterized membrane protein
VTTIFDQFLHPSLRVLHIGAGLVAIVAGFVALYAAKGAPVHRRLGVFFVYAMLVNAAAGTVLSIAKHDAGNVMGGSMSLYMAATALLTTRRRVARTDAAAMLLGTAVAVTGYTFAVLATRSVHGVFGGYPAPLYLFFGTIALLSVAGDIRMMLARGLHGKHRLVRHLWRMCFAMFIATGSFFIGQAKLLPKEYRIMPLLAIPVVIVLALMLYWALRVTFSERYPRRA